jgi:hypothetical protein
MSKYLLAMKVVQGNCPTFRDVGASIGNEGRKLIYGT